MIIDNSLVLSENQVITADAASTNVIDTGAKGTAYGHASALSGDLGKLDNEGVQLEVAVTEAFNTLTSLDISIEVSSDNSTFVEVAKKTYLLAALTAGRLDFPARLPEGTSRRYVRLYYNVNGTNPTLGKISAFIVAARQTN